MADLIDRDALMKEICGNECGSVCDEECKNVMCNFYDYIMDAPTIEPEMLLIPKEVSATDIDKLTEMIKGSLLQAYPNDAMFTAVRHGQWIAVSCFDACGGDEEAWMAHGNPIAYHYCSECKNETYLNEEGKEILSDYCPFCGADMREGGANND